MKAVLFILFSITLMACSGQNPNQSDSLLTGNTSLTDIDDTADETTDKTTGQLRLILVGGNLGQVASEVAKSGGQVIGEMVFVEALIANVPAAAINGLRNKFPEIEIFEDQVISLVDPLKKPDKPPGTGGGGGNSTPPPPQQTPWGITRIGADVAHLTSRGAGATVCVVDTGISKNHSDLVDNIVGGRNFIRAKGTTDPTMWNDDNGHGSHVAGIIAAVDNTIGSIGVAPLASLYGVKVLDRRGSGSLSGVTDGIYECIAQGVDVINMSLGASGDPSKDSPMKDAVDAAAAAGILVIVAAGNSGADISTTIPAGYASVIAVAATDSNDNFPSWSNFGLSANDFSAPGVSIYSTWKNDEYKTISGTSMAAPHMAGVAALAVEAASLGFASEDLGQTESIQGAGLIDAVATVLNIAP